MNIKTKVIYSNRLPTFAKLAQGPLFFIVDRQVYEKNSSIQNWLKEASHIYLVKGGESLKEIKAFPKHMKEIARITEDLSHRELTLVAVGGGSLGDFSGFVAATLKRGVRLVQVPTTWLAAMDSSHGGKNALNIGSFKNQIGTFYNPDQVFISKLALSSQAPSQLHDALGEFYKMALIEGNRVWGKKAIFAHKINAQFLWRQLPHVVKAKYKIVDRDPNESKGLRYILNLGHTIAHVLELKLKLSHGNAVSAGLNFMLWYSLEKKLLSQNEWYKIKKSPLVNHCSSIKIGTINKNIIRNALLNDKKKDSAKFIKFIFLINLGRTKIIPISINELVEAFSVYSRIQTLKIKSQSTVM